MFAPREHYHRAELECLLIVFDLRVPGAAEQLHHARAVWQANSDLQALDEDHFVLVLWPGGLWRVAA
jgi:hypothetical protein